MYEYLDNSDSVKVIGSFSLDKNADFKQSTKHLFESFQSQYQVDAISDISKILRVDALKEAYKEELLHDVMENSIDDDYYATMPDKLEQLFENSSLELLRESGVAALAPIVGITLPILKKSYIEGHSKDIVMTEVPTKPIIKAAYERRFLKNRDGKKFYIPDVFYDDSYKEVMEQGHGKPINNTWYPDGTAVTGFPFMDLDILGESGGSIQARDELALDFCVQAVKMTVDGADKVIPVSVSPNMAANSSFTAEIKTKNAAGQDVKDILTGQVDMYHGTVSCGSMGGLITAVQFGGHLSNENNNETIELDRERELLEWKIPDGVRINTGLTLEKIKDYKALFDFDITTEIIADMSTVLSQYEDSKILDYLNGKYDYWKNRDNELLPFGYTDGFIEEGYFSCEPPANKYVTRSMYIETELKYDLNRFIDELKIKLREQDLMFVVYGHPNNVTLIQDNVRWIIDEDTKIGGIQLDYRFGVMTANKNRIHVISTMKCPKGRGLRVVAYPLTKEIITFKHYKYSLNIENAYRNPLTPLTPNVMGTSRFITTDVLPVQGEFHILDNKFALNPPMVQNPATATQASTPVVSLAGGTYDGTRYVTVSSATPGCTFFYTVDGTDPAAGTGAIAGTGTVYNGSITIASSCTLKVIAVRDGYLPSAVASVEYTIN